MARYRHPVNTVRMKSPHPNRPRSRGTFSRTLSDAFLTGDRQPRPAITRGTHAAANVDELPVRPEDHVVLTPRFNPFIGTDLDLSLRSRGIRNVLLGGYSTNVGVESCARTARDLNCDVVILSDCCLHVERMNRTFREEWWEYYEGETDVPSMQGAGREGETVYNEIRPHQSLGMRTPVAFLAEAFGIHAYA